MTWRLASVLVAAIVVLATEACKVRSGSGSFAEGTCVLSAPQPCDGCVDFSLEARLGSGTKAGDYLDASMVAGYLVRDGIGRYWVGQRDHLKVFDSAGVLAGRIGRRGQGPMEFLSAYPIAVDSLGQVHVLDNLNGRVSVFDADLALTDQQGIPAFTIEMALMSGGSRYALSAWIPDARSAGYPIHVLSMEEITASLGVLADSLAYSAVLEPFDSERLIAIDRSGSILAARRWAYVVDEWDTNGRRLGRMEGPTLDDGLRGAPGPYSKTNPPWNGISDIHIDGSGLVWIHVKVRRPDWDTHVVETIAPDGSVSLQQGKSAHIYRSRIDVVDRQSCAVVSSSWFEGESVLSSFLQDGVEHTDGVLIEEIVRSDYADPIANIWHARLR